MTSATSLYGQRRVKSKEVVDGRTCKDQLMQIKIHTTKNVPGHIVRNSIWLKKNRISDNEGKFHSFLMCRIWIKNKFHCWKSELGCIWHIFGKFVSFQVLEHWQEPVFKKTEEATSICCLYWSTHKGPKMAYFSKNVPNDSNTDVQLWNQFLTIISDSTHQKRMKFAFIVTGSIFLQSYCVLDNVWRLTMRSN